MYSVPLVGGDHDRARHQPPQSLPITDTIQEDRDALNGDLLCTRKFERVSYIRLACIALALKLLELDGGDVLKRFAKCGALSENGSDQSVIPKKNNGCTTHIAEKYVRQSRGEAGSFIPLGLWPGSESENLSR